MKIGPRYKICRRLGSNVFEKCQTQQYVLSEAKHAKKQRRGRGGQMSDFGKQLIEKQRVRYAYGVQERQLRRYIEEAEKRSGDAAPTERMIDLLERRLDNVVFRAGLATSRRQARQLVSHGHITVNGRKMTIPSYHAVNKDVIAVRENSRESAYFRNILEKNENVTTPQWIAFDKSAMTVTLTGDPTPDNTDIAADLNAVLEFYSR